MRLLFFCSQLIRRVSNKPELIREEKQTGFVSKLFVVNIYHSLKLTYCFSFITTYDYYFHC